MTPLGENLWWDQVASAGMSAHVFWNIAVYVDQTVFLAGTLGASSLHLSWLDG